MASCTSEALFIDADDKNARAILTIGLEDAKEEIRKTHLKVRGYSADNLAALELQKLEFEQQLASLSSRCKAMSIRSAVIADGPLVDSLVAEEKGEAQDRRRAFIIEGLEPPALPTEPLRQSDRAIEVMCAEYVQTPTSGTLQQRQLITCVVCRNQFKYYEVLPMACGDEYCRPCLQTAYTQSFKAGATFPFKCCHPGPATPIETIRLFLTADLAKEHAAKTIEYSTPNRTYCAKPTCSAFIPPEFVVGNKGICQAKVCGTETCKLCHEKWHVGGCKLDAQVNALVKDIKRCPQCCCLVDHKGEACNSFHCRCGHKFCFVCLEKWKTCTCEPLKKTRKWEEYEGSNTVAPGICIHADFTREMGRGSCEACGFALRKVAWKCKSCGQVQCGSCAGDESWWRSVK